MIGLVEFGLTVGAVVLFGVWPLWRDKWREDRMVRGEMARDGARPGPAEPPR